MAIAAPKHFGNQLVVAGTKLAELEQSLLEKAVKALAQSQGSRRHVDLNVLAQQVLAAHSAGRDHPHAHRLEDVFQATKV